MVFLMSVIVWTQQNFLIPVIAVFVLLVVATYWPSRRTSMDRFAQIPFDADR